MNKGKYVFAQITQLLWKNEFDKIVDKFNANNNSRKLCRQNHLLQLLFGQITACNSLRNIALCLNAHKNKLYHIGIKAQVNESTLSRANDTRDARVFAEFGNFMIDLVRPYYCTTKIPKISIDNDIFALDSTTISLSIRLFQWAGGKYSRSAIKVHTLLDLRGNIPTFIHITDGKYNDSNALDVIPITSNAIYVMDKAYTDFAALYNINECGSYYVTRAKDNMQFKAVKSSSVDKSTGIMCDQQIKLTGSLSFKRYPLKFRRIKYRDKESGMVLVFITNNFDIPALEIAQIYKLRWQIEVFLHKFGCGSAIRAGLDCTHTCTNF